ncbi:serine hydrolase [Archangium minus]|uniref:Serine hydrolase n=1 Tax=Archangium minus TaxID=83450 RepID=A0ABY9X4B9_9BACT|nr:serine hydrolase [Archangium minus]
MEGTRGGLTLTLLVAIAWGLSACGHHRPTGPGSPPDLLADGWEVSSLEAEGLAPDALAELERRIEEGGYAAPDSLLIARNGKLVYERYWNGFQRDTPHDLRSATKSITSALVGIALEHEPRSGLDAPILSLLPEYAPLKNPDERKERMTPRHLLEMRSGLECDDWKPDSAGNEERMYRSRDWVKFILELPMASGPDESTVYCTGGVVVLGAWLENAVGMSVPEFSRRHLFEPLGITHVEWQEAKGGRTDTGGHLSLRPRDFAKLGQLFLDGGTWRGQRVIPEAWVRESTVGRHPLGDSKYGYLWWVNTFGVNGTPVEAFFARGNGGQYLFVFPSLRLVVAFTGSHYNDAGSFQPIDMCGRYVLPAALPRP